MKYVHQTLVIAAVCLAAELLRYLLPLPIPTSIYGLVLLFLLLKTGALKLSQVEDVGDLLLQLMPLLLVPSSVSLITVLDTLQSILLPVLLISLVGTILVMLVTGRVAQQVIRHGKGDRSRV